MGKNSLKLWEEAKSTFQNPIESPSKRARRATSPSSSLELQGISSPSRLRIGTRHKELWIPSHHTSRKRPRNELDFEIQIPGVIDHLNALVRSAGAKGIKKEQQN